MGLVLFISVTYILSRSGSKGNAGLQAIHSAAGTGNVSIRHLVEKHGNVNARDSESHTPLRGCRRAKRRQLNTCWTTAPTLRLQTNRASSFHFAVWMRTVWLR